MTPEAIANALTRLNQATGKTWQFVDTDETGQMIKTKPGVLDSYLDDRSGHAVMNGSKKPLEGTEFFVLGEMPSIPKWQRDDSITVSAGDRKAVVDALTMELRTASGDTRHSAHEGKLLSRRIAEGLQEQDIERQDLSRLGIDVVALPAAAFENRHFLEAARCPAIRERVEALAPQLGEAKGAVAR